MPPTAPPFRPLQPAVPARLWPATGTAPPCPPPSRPPTNTADAKGKTSGNAAGLVSIHRRSRREHPCAEGGATSTPSRYARIGAMEEQRADTRLHRGDSFNVTQGGDKVHLQPMAQEGHKPHTSRGGAHRRGHRRGEGGNDQRAPARKGGGTRDKKAHHKPPQPSVQPRTTGLPRQLGGVSVLTTRLPGRARPAATSVAPPQVRGSAVPPQVYQPCGHGRPRAAPSECASAVSGTDWPPEPTHQVRTVDPRHASQSFIANAQVEIICRTGGREQFRPKSCTPRRKRKKRENP